MANNPNTAREINLKTLVDNFLSWPLPETVCSDLCVTMGTEYKFPRSGTSLLSADEAEEMIKYLLNDLLDSLIDCQAKLTASEKQLAGTQQELKNQDDVIDILVKRVEELKTHSPHGYVHRAIFDQTCEKLEASEKKRAGLREAIEWCMKQDWSFENAGPFNKKENMWVFKKLHLALQVDAEGGG